MARNRPTPKDRAIAIAGGVTRLAEKIGITRSAVSQWHEIPIDRVADVQRATGLTKYEQRPDIFDPPEKVA